MYSTRFEPRVLHQEDGCTYRYGTFCLHANSTSSLFIPLTCNRLYYNCIYNSLPADEPSGSKHVEDIVQIKILF
jgi:hypothetical protein